LDRGRSDFDIGHLVSAVFSLDMPVGRGRRFLPSLPRFANATIGGWQLSGTARLSTGMPLTVMTQNVNTNLGESSRPNRVAKGLPTSELPGRRGVDYPWYVSNAFEVVPCVNPSKSACLGSSPYGFLPFQPGNAGRNILDGPGKINVDLGIRKNFRFGDSRSVQVRIDSFNTMNHTNFNMPNRYVDSAASGLISSVPAATLQVGPRVLQMAITLRF
jgi:hypothetical protein